jgi:3-oxosteroid 1-dehydrogenase
MASQEKEDAALSRRQLLKGVVLGGAGVATAGMFGSETPASASLPNKWDMEADVVCIGYGGAAAVTAITAADLGASVIIIEKQPSDTANEIHHTPNTRSATGAIICPTDAQKASDHLFAASWGTTPRDICDAWGKYGVTNAQWIEKLGGKLTPENNHSGGGDFRQLPGSDAIKARMYQGGGPAFYKFLDDNVQRRKDKIQVVYETPGKELVMDAKGTVTGVIAEKAGKRVAIKGNKAVVLTCGGYEWDEEFKANTLRGYPAYFYGNPGNTGDGVRMAAKAGAGLWHMNTAFGRLTPFMPGYKPAFRGGTPNGFILVDKYGKRFFRERPMPSNTLPNEICKFDPELCERPAIPCYSIFDDTALKLGEPASAISKGLLSDGRQQRFYDWSKDYADEIKSGFLMKGETIEELAQMIVADKENEGRMTPEVLRATIERYNDFCMAKQDAEFDRDPATLIPVAKGPFYAMKLYPGGAVTQGGPKKNAKSQVLDAFNHPIPHLYCVGELGSIYGFLYPASGGNLCELLVFGRVAGENIVNEMPASASSAQPKPIAAATATAVASSPSANAPKTDAVPAASKESCLECHGPFDKLSSAQANYVADDGKKINPHRFVPHDAAGAKSVPECSSCHTPHPLPHTPQGNPSKADIAFCFDSCHHTKNFTSCKECHK